MTYTSLDMQNKNPKNFNTNISQYFDMDNTSDKNLKKNEIEMCKKDSLFLITLIKFIDDKENAYIQNKSLLNFDISKNKIKLIFDQEFLDLIKNSQLQELDISSNIEPESVNNDPGFQNFKEILKKISHIKVHI